MQNSIHINSCANRPTLNKGREKQARETAERTSIRDEKEAYTDSTGLTVRENMRTTSDKTISQSRNKRYTLNTRRLFLGVK